MIVYCVNAFTKDGSGGNGAGVVVLETPLSETVKTQIAKTMGYSETAFVSTSDVADFKLEYFTPEGEVPLCGHATIGTFVVLNSLQLLEKSENTIQTKAGVLEVTVEDDGRVFMEQTLPDYGDILDGSRMNPCLHPLSLAAEYPVQLVSTGLKDILMAVDGVEALASMTPDFPAITAISKAQDCVGIHAFALVNTPDLTAICRNFAPLYGIDEEAATGTSNCALACYLFRYGLRQQDYVFEQGYQLNSVSKICVHLGYTGDTITKVAVGGYGKLLKMVTLIDQTWEKKVEPVVTKNLYEELRACKDMCHQFNQLRPSDDKGKDDLLRILLGKVGKNLNITQPFFCDFGYNIHLGEDFYANHNLVVLDGAKVTIGDHVFIAPNCCISTASHPLDVEQRDRGIEYAQPITIGNSVWIGAGVTIIGGVTIGDGTVIGAGSIVTKNIPSGVIAVGNPCKVLRPITEKDRYDPNQHTSLTVNKE